jgi:cell division protein FtsB
MVGKPSKIGEIFKLTMGLYECGSCGKSFRNVEGKEKTTIKEVIDRNETLEEKLMEASKRKLELEERVQALETEKACLLAEVEALRLIPMLEQKASSLEDDIKELHEEKEALIQRVEELTSGEGAEVAPAIYEKTLESYVAKPASAIPDVSIEGASTELPVIDASQSAVTPIETKCEPIASEVAPTEPSISEVPVEVVSPETVTIEAPKTESVTIETPVEAPADVPAIEVSNAVAIPTTDLSTPVVQVEAPMPEGTPLEVHLEEKPVEVSPAVAPEVVEVSTGAEVEVTPVVSAEIVEEKPVDVPSTTETDLTVSTPQIESIASAIVEEIKTEAIPIDAISNVLPEVKPVEAVQVETFSVEETHVESPSAEGAVEVSTSTNSVAEPPVVEVSPQAPIDETKPETPSTDQLQDGALLSNPNVIDASTLLNSITEKIQTEEILTGETSKVQEPEKKLDETPPTGATL